MELRINRVRINRARPVKSTLQVSISFSDFFEDNVLIISINLLKFSKELLRFFVFPFDIICGVLGMLLLRADGFVRPLPLPALLQATIKTGWGPVPAGRHIIRGGDHVLPFSYLQNTVTILFGYSKHT